MSTVCQALVGGDDIEENQTKPIKFLLRIKIIMVKVLKASRALRSVPSAYKSLSVSLVLVGKKKPSAS